jgi:hypothetical protein
LESRVLFFCCLCYWASILTQNSERCRRILRENFASALLLFTYCMADVEEFVCLLLLPLGTT